MSENKAKSCKKFLQLFFLKWTGVAGAILLISSGIALFLTERSQSNIKYVAFCLVGFVLLASSSYFGFGVMNKKEKELPLRALKKDIK